MDIETKENIESKRLFLVYFCGGLLSRLEKIKSQMPHAKTEKSLNKLLKDFEDAVMDGFGHIGGYAKYQKYDPWLAVLRETDKKLDCAKPGGPTRHDIDIDH